MENKPKTLCAKILGLALSIMMLSVTAAMGSSSVASDATDNQPVFSHRLIVELESPPLILSGVTAVKAGKGIDLNSVEAQAYVSQLQAEQRAVARTIARNLPNAQVTAHINEVGARVQNTYQVAFNGMAIDPGTTDLEAAMNQLRKVKGVKQVYKDYQYYPTLGQSGPMINAPALYANPDIGGIENAGEGIIIASMDGGLHHAAPMFDGTGYTYPEGYPKGDETNCNGKIIASRAYFRDWDPPKEGEGNTWPGTEGTSHGTHTGSTAGGNAVTANYLGSEFDISGIAPKAYLTSYKMFYESDIDYTSGFYSAEAIAALEDIITDGAHVLNNSWGGGPTSLGGEFDPIDNALKNVADAGIFVAMSTGNAGPGPATVDHPSDFYITVGAVTKDMNYQAGSLGASTTEDVAEELTGLAFTITSEFGVIPEFGTVIDLPFLPSLYVDPDNVTGCGPFPADAFAGHIALISRGSCNFSDKATYAYQAGAEMVIIYNNAGDDLVNMAVGDAYNPGDVQVPCLFIGQTDGEALIQHFYDVVDGGGEATIEFSYAAVEVPGAPDYLASFSSIGPAVGNILKPDIVAPGVGILAQGYTDGATGEDRHLGWGTASGTSMAAPHVSGAAALLRQIHPDWGNGWIRSALKTTSKYLEVYDAFGFPAQPLVMGAGRIDLTNAADPGVICLPSSLSFGPMESGAVHTMEVELTSVADTTETYTVSTVNTEAGFDAITTVAGVSFEPAEITLAPNETATLTITFDSTELPVGDTQGYVVLTSASHEAHMPVWGRVMPDEATADLLVLDLDLDGTLNVLAGLGWIFGSYVDYSSYYTDALDKLGVTYDVMDLDAMAQGDNYTLPTANELSTYKAILLFTGDNFLASSFFNDNFGFPYPLTWFDMDVLTEYANNGGAIIAMGQDLASVLESAYTWQEENDQNIFMPFLYEVIFGAQWLQDSLTGYGPPEENIMATNDAPEAFEFVKLDVGVSGDGAANQYYIDELKENPYWQSGPDVDPDEETIIPLFRYPDSGTTIESGVCAYLTSDMPSLSRTEVLSNSRAVYCTFGLEGVNNRIGATSRSYLLGLFLDWAMEKPVLEIENMTREFSGSQVTLEALFESNLDDSEVVQYRWDMGDGAGPQHTGNKSTILYDYDEYGVYTVVAEATTALGNRVVAVLDINVEKRPADIEVTGTDTVYTGQPKRVKVRTLPGGLRYSVEYEVDGTWTTSAPVNAGEYPVKVIIDDDNYKGEVNTTLDIEPAQASIILTNIFQTYDGEPKPISVITVPSGLPYDLTYETGDVPVDIGTYTVEAEISDPNYTGSTSGFLIILEERGDTGGLPDWLWEWLWNFAQ